MVYRCDKQYVLASHLFCVRKTRFLCSQNTFFVFATPIKTWGNTVSLKLCVLSCSLVNTSSMEEKNKAKQKRKNDKTPTILRGKEPYLCAETNSTPQTQETQNDSTATICEAFFMSKRVLAEGASKLTQAEIAMLEYDIFKPLDFNEILFNRMKSGDYRGRIINNLDELWILLLNLIDKEGGVHSFKLRQYLANLFFHLFGWTQWVLFFSNVFITTFDMLRFFINKEQHWVVLTSLLLSLFIELEVHLCTFITEHAKFWEKFRAWNVPFHNCGSLWVNLV